MVMDESKTQIGSNKVGKTSQALSPVKLHKIKGAYGQVESGGEGDGEGESAPGGDGMWSISRQDESSGAVPSSSYKELRISQSHSKKVIKHALRQQAKRRRKNTTIAAGNSAPLPRILMPPQCELEEVSNRTCYRPPTMLEVLSSIPGFSIKQRKRSNKKLSAAAQLEQTKEGCIDLETPDSILVNTNLRSLLNKHTFNTLPALYQYKLVQLLPHVDRTTPASDSFRLSASGLNNEFFARACLEWRERLAEGEFTPENQQKLKAEAEREKSKLDPWKLKHFEPIWGESSSAPLGASVRLDWTPPPAVAPLKPAKPAVKVKTPPTPPPPRLRTVGAITRAVANYREKREAEENSMLMEPNKRIKSSSTKSESLKTETTSPVETIISPQSHTEKRFNKTEHKSEEVKKDKVKDNWQEEMTDEVKLKNKSIDMAENTDVIQEWENVELINVEPVQEYIDVNTHEEKDPVQLCDNDKDRPVCDISSNENAEVKNEAMDKEEVNIFPKEGELTESEQLDLKEESQAGDDSQEESHSGCTFSQQSVPDDDITEAETETLTNENISAPELNDAINKNDENKLDSDISESLYDETNNQDKHQNNEVNVPSETYEEQISKNTDEDNDNTIQNQEESECISNLDSTTQLEDSPPQDDSEMPGSQDSISNYECNNAHNEEELSNLNNCINSNERQPIEENSEEKFFDVISENNLNEDRFDVDMANINDSLEFVNEETSLQPVVEIQDNQEPISDQEFVDSRSELKEDNGGYCVKIEEELDLQDSTSNVQSQDSQDTRPDEDNSPEFIVPDSEVPVSGMDESGGSTRGDGTFNIYNSVLYQEALKEEEVEAAAIFAAAWGAVDSSTEKLLAQVALQEEGEVNVIPMQEELEVRLEEIKSVPEWQNYEKLSTPAVPMGQPTDKPQFPGHVKLELEVTLTPEVDSQVSSTMEGSTPAGGSGLGNNGSVPCDESSVAKSTALTVIPPTTIVCLPSAIPQPPPHTTQPGVVSSSAVPYLALSTSTPVRALPTKPKPSSGISSGGRSSRNVSSKPPPGAVNLERSYQICQAVIQNSPNRDQLRCQLKPPPSLLIGKSDKTQYSVVTSSRGGKVAASKPRAYQQRPTTPVLVKHVFTSSQGIPVTMAVLPHTQPTTNPEVAESQMGHYVLVQRTGAQIRRSNSAPPSNNENIVGVGGRGRPASVGEGGGDSPTPGCYPNKHALRSADCQCSLKAMIACKKCGAFWHDDCIDPSRVCVTCHIR